VFLNGDIAEKITRIKQQEGPDLHVYGSASLVQTLMNHDLVDAFWLKTFPITLGVGNDCLPMARFAVATPGTADLIVQCWSVLC
jgi:dihydrofolate reductase